MFNVCPECGEYTDAKEIVAHPVRAICPTCGYARPFRSLPLFVITGASGSGKTTVALELGVLTNDFVVLDQDILWNDAFNEPANDYQMFRNTWLRLAKNINQAGKSVVLVGSAIPKQYESCVERRYLSHIHYLALVADPAELERRLKSRPAWRKSESAENLQKMLDFNNWLVENSSKTEPAMTLLDTSRQTLAETVIFVQHWLKEKMSGAL